MIKPIGISLGLMLVLPGAQTNAAMVSGKVATSSGLPVSGALITIRSEDTNRQKTVYTSLSGSYQLQTDFTGNLKLRVRTQHFNDVVMDLPIKGDEALDINPVLSEKKDAQMASDTLTASAHSATMEFDSPELKASFISQCNYCHQIGNSLTRRPRDYDGWAATVDRMTGYMALLSDDEKEGVAKALYQSFDGSLVENVQNYEYSAAMEGASIEEWFFGDGLAFPHDAEVGSDGLFYAADEGHDVIWEIHPDTGEVKRYPLPVVDLPKGGNFSALQLPIGVYSGQHGPHSLVEDDSGTYWITNALSGYLSTFNIHSKEQKLYKIPGSALYPHTLRLDKKGNIWFTLAISNAVGKFDPKTETFDIIDLPSNGFMRWVMDWSMPIALKVFDAWPERNYPLVVSPQRWAERGRDLVNLPYGIDVNPVDGSIWYAKLLANKLGRIDPETLEVEEIDVPLSGPRRPRFASDGTLWIPAFDHGAIMSFDPVKRTFKTYRMPTLAPGEWEAPYALNVNNKTGDVWITSNTSDRLFRFNPKTEVFTAYPLPTRVTWMRDIVFTEDGKVCNSSSNLPAYAIEGGRPSIICLKPD